MGIGTKEGQRIGEQKLLSWEFYEWVLWPLDLCGKLASSIIGDFVDSLETLIVLDFSNIVSLA